MQGQQRAQAVRTAWIYLLELMQRYAAMPDEIPVVLDTQARPIGNRKTAIFADCSKLIAVPIRINRRHRIGAFRTDQSQLVIIGVANSRHAMPVSRTGRMDLHIQTKRFGEM